MLFIAFHALAFIIMVDESTGCLKARKCEDILDEDGYWKVEHYTLSKTEESLCCKGSGGSYPRSKQYISSVEDCKKKKGLLWRSERTTWRGKVEANDIEAGHWTFGKCSNDEESCLNARFDSSNITEIMGVQLARLDPDSIAATFIKSLTFPNEDSMNCEELCNCFSCGHGHCSDQENHDKCYGNGSGFICKCENSDSYPSFRSIIKEVLATGMACRQCKK